WGLITFREQLLLCDDHTSLSTKQYIAIVVAHELTHQWFGNLVTMRWWTDLWLNEGFASWMEYLAVDKLFPEWHLWRQFAVDDQQTALKADALEHTHPIEVAVHHPDEIRTIFDIISYQKGASAIHMLNDYLGPELFRDGLRHYLKTHAYKNTDTVDLWQALEDVTKLPVKKFMSAWTSNAGFPILKVSEENDHFVIEQSRFVTNPKSEARKDKTLWPVPILADGLDNITVTKKVSNIPFSGKTGPIKINQGQTGFYRVDYSHELQSRQIKALAYNELSDIDRMGLLSDGFETTKAGYQPVNEYLDLLEFYRDESSLAVWEIIAGSIGSIRNTLSTSDQDNTLRELMKPFIQNLVQLQLTKLGWTEKKNESHLNTLLRPLILGMAAGSDHEQTITKCLELYRLKIDKNTHINPDLRAIIYSTAARLGGEKEYEELLNLYRTTHSNDEKLSITAAMTSFKQPEINLKVLELMKSREIRLQDLGYWIAYSFMNRHARQMTWEWMKINWSWLKDNIGTDLSFARTPVYAARNFYDEKDFQEYKKFFSANMEPLIDRSYKQGLEIIETNSAWRERDHQLALDWFKSKI
ncbi:MAG: M1 family metallopeptidase, partial [Candidatus Saccharibacteria bacterium]|nr:M1 family metallopeptidase [Candidatus Saccharibacteria bacterium]